MTEAVLITLDVDWAPDFAIDAAADLLRAAGVPATWFVTHASPALDRLRQTPELFELGIHPNFMPGSTHGETPAEVLRHMRTLVPEARCSRSHGLCQSGPILSALVEAGIETDLSLFLPGATELSPCTLHLPGGPLARIPYAWSDDHELSRPGAGFGGAPALLDAPGLRALTFHPLLLALNASSPTAYAELREATAAPLTELEPGDLEPFVEAGSGVRTVFERVLERLRHGSDAARVQDVFAPAREVSRPAARVASILREQVGVHGLDLTGLVVYTEAASGAYLHTPILAALAGAEQVIARTRDSRFMPAAEVARRTRAEAEAFGVGDRIEVVFERRPQDLSRADIVTNSGFVRPIDAELVGWLKPTAVIPLMWETWEFRPEELALDACRERGVLVLGTDESAPPLSIDPYAGMLALRMLFDLGLAGYRSRVVLVGSSRFGRRIATSFQAWGIETTWFSSGADEGARPLTELPAFWAAQGSEQDVLLLAELSDRRTLVGPAGVVAASVLAAAQPDLRVGVLAGVVDGDDLRRAGLRTLPRALPAPGYMGYQLYDIDPRPILELYAAGLKVGQEMARARLDGASPTAAARRALKRSAAMDFLGDLAWLS